MCPAKGAFVHPERTAGRNAPGQHLAAHAPAQHHSVQLRWHVNFGLIATDGLPNLQRLGGYVDEAFDKLERCVEQIGG